MRRIDNLLLLFQRFLKEMEIKEYYTHRKKIRNIHGHMPYYWYSLLSYNNHHNESYLMNNISIWSFLWQYYVLYTLNFIDTINKSISYEFDDTVRLDIGNKKELKYHNVLANIVDYLVVTDDNDDDTKIWLCRQKRIDDCSSDVFPIRQNLFGGLNQFLYTFLDDETFEE